MEVIVVSRPAIDPEYFGHMTTVLYDITKLPSGVLNRILSLTDEFSWVEVIEGNFYLDPLERFRIRELVRKAEVPLNDNRGHYNIPDQYKVRSVHVYPIKDFPISGKHVVVHIQVTLANGGYRHEYYYWNKLTPTLQSRLVVRKGYQYYLDNPSCRRNKTEDDYYSVMYEASRTTLPEQQMLKDASVPQEALKDTKIGLERAYLEY